MKLKYVVGMVLAAMALLLTACGGESIEELRIAITIDDDNPQQAAAFEHFRAGLEAHVGIPVRIIEDATHQVGIEAMRAGNLDIMWASPFAYLMAKEVMDVERLAVTDNPNSINKTVFITAQDDIQNLADMRGRRFAFISPSSSSGFFYPLYHLMNTFDLTRTEVEAGGFFSTVSFSGHQRNSIIGVINGDFDAAAVGNLNLGIMIDSGLIGPDDVRIIGDTEIIPFPGYIAIKTLPNDIIEKVREYLLAYDNEEYFAARFNTPDTRYVMPNEEQITHLSVMAEVLEIDLSEQ